MDTDNTQPADIVYSDVPNVRPKTWALVDGGFVSKVLKSFDYVRHPFGSDADGKVVIDVSGTQCQPGWVMDHKGNVAPSEGATEPLLPHEPAYHDRSNPMAPPVATVPATLLGNEPHDLMKAGAEQPDGGQDNNASETDNDHTTGDAVDRGEHPTAGLVQEHGVVQGEIRTDETPAVPPAEPTPAGESAPAEPVPPSAEPTPTE